MRRSDYLELIARVKDPYYGYKMQQSVLPVREYDAAEQSKACDELFAAGYRMFLHRDGATEDSFFPRVWEECSNFLDKTGVLPDLVYCDEDRITSDTKSSYDPFFKPDFSPDTLMSFFYIGGALLIRGYEATEFINEFGEEDYLPLAGFILKRFINNTAGYNAVHIDEVLFHSGPEVAYQYPEGVRPKMGYYPGDDPGAAQRDLKTIKVRAVILTKDNPDMLKRCIDSFMEYSDISMDYIVIDNGSDEKNRLEIKAELDKRGITDVYHPSEFIYSALCNLGADYEDEHLKKDYDFLLLLNDDVILPGSTKGFPSALLEKAACPHVGAVGVKLHYPKADDSPDEESYRIQHCGITLLKQGPSHKLCTYKDDVVYERGRNIGIWNVMAVTGACLLVDAKKYHEIGGFDEKLHISYTDVDLCMDLWEKGYYNVVMNDIPLIHAESVTRGRDIMDDAKAQRLKKERRIFFEKHPYLKESGDIFYNKNLTSIRLDYSPDIIYEWEKDEFAHQIDDFDGDYKVKHLPQGSIMSNIDSIRYVPDLFGQDATMDSSDGITTGGDVMSDSGVISGAGYEITGWCIRHGKDMLFYEPCLVMDIAGEKTYFTATRQYREDLQAVFPKEKNVLLSGFVCRIPADLISISLDHVTFTCGLIKKDFFGNTLYLPRIDSQS